MEKQDIDMRLMWGVSGNRICSRSSSLHNGSVQTTVGSGCVQPKCLNDVGRYMSPIHDGCFLCLNDGWRCLYPTQSDGWRCLYPTQSGCFLCSTQGGRFPTNEMKYEVSSSSYVSTKSCLHKSHLVLTAYYKQTVKYLFF